MKTLARWFPIVAATLFATGALAQTVLDSSELYPGEKALMTQRRRKAWS